jgi:hypothetical protein
MSNEQTEAHELSMEKTTAELAGRQSTTLGAVQVQPVHTPQLAKWHCGKMEFQQL